MRKLTQLQRKVFKRGLQCDRMYADCQNTLCKFVEPIIGKNIHDIKFKDKKKHPPRRSEYITTKGKLFELWRIDGHESNTLYVITIDSKIVYYTFCSIFAPASSAFHTLTEVYFLTYINGCPVYASLNEATYFNVLWEPHPDSKQIVKRIKNAEWFINKLYVHY
jgi:hypothetical protein